MLKSIWICFCTVVLTTNRRCSVTGHLSSMAQNYFKYLTRFFWCQKNWLHLKVHVQCALQASCFHKCPKLSVLSIWELVSDVQISIYQIPSDEWLRMKETSQSISKDFAMNLKDNMIPAWTRQYPLLYYFYNPKEFIPSTLLAVLWPQRYEVHTVSL